MLLLLSRKRRVLVPVIPETDPAANGHKCYRPQNRYLLTRAEAADYLGVSVSTLAHWPAQGKGPRQRVIGRRAYYHVADLDAWLELRPAGRCGQ